MRELWQRRVRWFAMQPRRGQNPCCCFGLWMRLLVAAEQCQRDQCTTTDYEHAWHHFPARRHAWLVRIRVFVDSSEASQLQAFHRRLTAGAKQTCKQANKRMPK